MYLNQLYLKVDFIFHLKYFARSKVQQNRNSLKSLKSTTKQ